MSGLGWGLQIALDETQLAKSLHMITIRFRSGEQKSFKAGTTELRDGTLILYTRHRRGLPWRPKFPVDNIEWVRLSNGSVMIEVPDRQMWDCRDAVVSEPRP